MTFILFLNGYLSFRLLFAIQISLFLLWRLDLAQERQTQIFSSLLAIDIIKLYIVKIFSNQELLHKHISRPRNF